MNPRPRRDASPSVDLPSAWVEERAFGSGTEKFAPLVCTFPDQTPIVLSYELDLLAGPSLTRDVLQKELAGAVWLDKTSSKHADSYLLRTAGCTLRVDLRTGRQQVALMQITSAKKEENAVVAEQSVRAVFALREASKNASADLQELWRFFADKRDGWRKQHEQWQVQRTTQARKELTRSRPPDEVEARARLHYAVDRRYGQLESMLKLFERRVKLEMAADATGVLETPLGTGTMEDEGVLFCLRVTERQGKFEKDNHVEFPGMAARKAAPPKTILKEIRGDLFFFARTPALAGLPSNKKIKFKLAPRQPWIRHIQALQRFKSCGTAGDWAQLARLLTTPGDLRANFRRPLPKHWFAEHRTRTRLNDEQKNAVAGAVAAPHAFFIQGPPGTGKTTVIVELIEQLAHAGERILLLAPMHVAVDAVLERVGDAPGIRPLRLTWSETLVSDAVLPFTYEHIKQNLIKGLRTPRGSQADRWRSAAARLRDGLIAERTRAATLARRVAAGRAAARARSERSAFEARMRKRASELAAAVGRTADELAAVETRLTEHRLQEAEARTQAATGQATAGVFGKIGAALRFGELATLRTRWVAAQRALTASSADKDQFAATLRRAEDARSRFADESRGTLAALTEQAVSTRKEFAKAAGAWSLLEPPRGTRPNRRQAEAYREQVERQEGKLARMEAYPDLEARWFDLTHPTDEDADAVARRLAEKIGHELVAVTNLFCSTTTGVAGDPIIRDLEKNHGLHFDTLILDEASRVTDADFLIGAVRTRRWILVGDEKQLPPHADPENEHFLHALAAIHRAHTQRAEISRGARTEPPAACLPVAKPRREFWDRLPAGEQARLENAVQDLAELWKEEKTEYQFRHRAVQDLAAKLIVNGDWASHYRTVFTEQQNYLRRDYKDANQDEDANRELLRAMDDFLISSVFARCVEKVPSALCQKLVSQRRMILPLARIISEPIYDGDYKTPGEEELARCGVTELRTPTFKTPVTFMNTSLSGKNARDELDGTGFTAPLEAAWIVGACVNYERDLAKTQVTALTVSILCFYRAQAELIRKLKADWHSKEPFKILQFRVVDAIDKIQGQESDLVMLSFGRVRRGGNHPDFGRWLQDLRRLNVACSRAHRAMVFVGHQPTLMSLRSTPGAEKFYAHFFGLFDEHLEDMKIIESYRPPEPKTPRR